MDVLSSIGSAAPLPLRTPDTSDISKVKKSFSDILSASIGQVNLDQVGGDQAIETLQTGNAEHLHEVMIAIEEADVSLRMLVQMRNKALQAYDEIMRMQI